MKAAVLGSPVSHSLSPALHRAAYRALGLAGWTYQAIECDEAGLPARLAGCGPGWAGLSLTMPLKRAVLPLLDEAEPLVKEVGTANTVVFAGGLCHGHNTDVPGMVGALTEAGLTGLASGPSADGHGPAGRPGPAGPLAGGVLILGGGATACSALAAVSRLGATSATVAVRDRSRSGDLLAVAGRLGMAVTLTGFGLAAGTTPDLLVSTVPAGAADACADQVATGAVRARYVFDVVYHPWPTALAAAAGQAGAVFVDGFSLLLHQAAGQVALMTGRPAPLAAMRAAGLASLGA